MICQLDHRIKYREGDDHRNRTKADRKRTSCADGFQVEGIQESCYDEIGIIP